MGELRIASQFHSGKPLVSGGGSSADEPVPDEFRTRAQLADVIFIRSAIQARARRRRYFNSNLFADPAWDMLLELYAASLTQRRLTVSKLGERSGVPMTTALRWIATLEKEGLIERSQDRLDGRRIFLALSPKGSSAMAAYFDDSPAGTLFL